MFDSRLGFCCLPASYPASWHRLGLERLHGQPHGAEDSLWEALAASGCLGPGQRRACGLGSGSLPDIVLDSCTRARHCQTC